MATTAELQVWDRIFIGGEWVEPEGSETIEVVKVRYVSLYGTHIFPDLF